MPNGYDEEKRQVLVPFDLKRDIVEPLERLEDSVNDLKHEFAEHIQDFKEHKEDVDNNIKTRMIPAEDFLKKLKSREEKKEKAMKTTKTILVWIIGIAGPVAAAIIYNMEIHP